MELGWTDKISKFHYCTDNCSEYYMKNPDRSEIVIKSYS